MFKKFFAIVFVSILLLCAAGYFLLFTRQGIALTAHHFLSKYLSGEEISYEKSEGSLLTGLTFYNIEITQLRKFPPGSFIRIQSLFVQMPWFDKRQFVVGLDNLRLKLP